MNPKAPRERELTFDSNFESGNLDYVVKRGQFEYDLYMRVDTNTRGHHQWFYFAVHVEDINYFGDKKIKLNVMNFTKPTSLY